MTNFRHLLMGLQKFFSHWIKGSLPSRNVFADTLPKSLFFCTDTIHFYRTRAVLNKSISGGVAGDGRWPPLSK